GDWQQGAWSGRTSPPPAPLAMCPGAIAIRLDVLLRLCERCADLKGIVLWMDALCRAGPAQIPRALLNTPGSSLWSSVRRSGFIDAKFTTAAKLDALQAAARISSFQFIDSRGEKVEQ